MPGQTPARGGSEAAPFTFISQWCHPGDAGRVFDVLADLGAYPRWWPQVRAVAVVDSETARVVCRSVLPYHLDLQLARLVEDRDAGVLEADIAGDLEGWSRWTLTRLGGGTHVAYEQQVRVVAPRLALAARVGRPVLVANHRWMMRGGRRGLLRQAPGPHGRTSR